MTTAPSDSFTRVEITGIRRIELIALRMRRREDIDVFELGIFVRANLISFEQGVMSFPDIHTRFMAAALAAPLGPAEFAETLHIGTRGCRL